MEKEKNKEQALPVLELPSIKKIVDCPRCKAKIEVEFEIGMDMIMPELAKASLPIAPPAVMKEELKEKKK